MSLHTFQSELTGVIVDANTEQFKTEKFPDNANLCLQHVCVVNHNKNNAKVQIGFLTGQQVMWVACIKCVTQGQYYYDSFNVFFKGARNVVVKWSTADSGDKVEAYVYGYYRE